jgi:hypothetical protein
MVVEPSELLRGAVEMVLRWYTEAFSRRWRLSLTLESLADGGVRRLPGWSLCVRRRVHVVIGRVQLKWVWY